METMKGVTKVYKEKDKKILDKVEEWKKARSGDIDNRERVQLLRNKNKEKIQRQEQLREAYLLRVLKQARLTEMQKNIEFVLGLRIANPKDITPVRWLDKVLPYDLAVAEFNLEWHYYKRAVENENYIKGSLIGIGFNDGQIDKIINGSYIKDLSELKHMEEKVMKCEECGDDFVAAEDEDTLCIACFAEAKPKKK